MTIIEELRQRYLYDYVNGTFQRRWGSHLYLHGDSQLYMKRRGVRLRVYVAAWSMYHGRLPNGQIDHENRNHDDITIKNLREATHQQNNFNSVHKSTSGLKGASLTNSGRWQAGIHINNERIHLGVFDTAEEAHAAYVKAAKKYHGEFMNVECFT